MKKLIALLLIIAPCLMAQVQPSLPAQGNLNGILYANGFGGWTVPMGNAGPFSWTSPVQCTANYGGTTFAAFTPGTPINLYDQLIPAHNETLTVTTVNVTTESCSITTSTPAYNHTQFSLGSATAGLQEAIDANLNTATPTTVHLTSQWYATGGQIGSVTSTITGNASIGIVDDTTTPTTWYEWNAGTGKYIAVGISGTAGKLGTLQGDVLGNNAANSAAVDEDIFVATTQTTGVSTINPQTAVNNAVANNGSAVVGAAVCGVPFTNAQGVKVQVNCPGATVRSVQEFGAVCDARAPFVTFTQGTSTINISSDTFSAADIGKKVIVSGLVGSLPTRFITTITAVGGGAATVQSPFPFSQLTAAQVKIATDNTAAIQQAFNSSASHTTNNTPTTSISFPAGNCFSHTIQYTGVSIQAVDNLHSVWSGAPGEDMLTEGDAAAGTAVPNYGATWNMPTMAVDDSIDTTQAWQDINETTTTAHAAVYHPAGILTASSNNPTAPGWFQGSGLNGSGAYVGAASITAGSAVICVPNVIVPPPIGNKVVFPWLTNGILFTSTISSTGGSCPTNYTSRTLANNLPTTAAQAEWFTGISPQTISANVSGTSCPSTITVTNPVIPSPASESNVAPQGLFQIDGEQFAYTFRTNAGAPAVQSFSGVICAQNGTTRAAHSSGATVFPLNPFVPTKAWPITPTLTSGSVTPNGAGYYPAWNIGNSAFSAYNSNGNLGQVGLLGFSNAVVQNWTVIPSDGIPHNNTAAMYFVGLPYNTDFSNLNFAAHHGIVEATPVTNTGGAFANSQPTADGTRWHGVRINACHTSDFISGGQNTFRDWNVYSDCYAGGTYTGAGTAYYFSQGWNDETGYPQSIQGNITTDNLYAEPEAGSSYGTFPVFEFDISKGVHTNMHMGGGGEFPIGGNNQTWIGGNFNNQAIFPVLNYGANNGSDGTQLLAFGNSVGNVYGTNSLLSWGQNAHFSGSTSQQNPQTSPYGANQLGNSREPWHGQSNDTFATGNTTAPYVNPNSGFIPAAEFNTSFAFESQAFNIPWSYDSATYPDGSPAGGSVGCNVNTGGTANCFTSAFNQAGIKIGPGQRLVAGKYTFTVGSHSTGAATTYQIKLGACSIGDTATLTVPVSAAYSTYTAQIDFTGPASSCPSTAALSMDVIYAAPANDVITMSYIDFAPRWQAINVDTINTTTINVPGGVGGTTGCAQSPVTGIKQGYSCPTSGWNEAVGSAQGISDTTIVLATTAGLPAAGCFAIENEDECYTSIVNGTTLGGITRGAYTTTAATHAAGTFPGAISINLALVSPQQPVTDAIFGYGAAPPLLGVNTMNPQNHAGSSVLSINNGNNEFWFDNTGGFHGQNASAASTMLGSLNIGNQPGSPSIANTANVMQQQVKASFYVPQTLGGGHAGSLNVIQTPALPAPTVTTLLAAGSTTLSWVCSGTDFDGNTVPGATTTLTNGQATWASPFGYTIYCPYVAGINTYQIYRTAGGVNQGLVASGVGPGLIFNDLDVSATSGTPPVSNSSNPHISVAGIGIPTITLGSVTIASGTGAPTSTCGTAPNGSGSLWLRTDGAASTSLYSCAGTTWTAVTIP